jgi:replicative DNA helicase
MSEEDDALIRLNPRVPQPEWTPSEKAVLSMLIQDPVMLADAPLLSDDHFHDVGRRTVFSAIRRICEESSPSYDLLNDLRRHLHQRGEFHLVGGDAGLSGLHNYETFVSPGRLAKELKILNNELARRKAIKAGLNLIEEAYGCGEEIERVVEAAGSPITEIHDALTASAPPKDTKQLLREVCREFKARVRGEKSSMGISTLPEIDQFLRGLHPGRVWVIGAYPSGGKSVIASQILMDISLDGVPSCFVSLEMSEMDLMQRAVVMAARIDSQAFLEPDAYIKAKEMNVLPKAIINAVSGAVDRLVSAPFLVRKPSTRSLAAVLATIRKAVRDHSVKVVAVDYLQLINPPQQHRNEESGIAAISHALQELTQELGISLLLLTQLNEAGDTKRGRVIEEDADAFLQIVQDRDKTSATFKQHRHILLVKDRHYGQGGARIPLIFDKDKVRFVYGMNADSKATNGNQRAPRR